ncbi:MAG: S8 family serine peptidase [Gammaproteobacteria bacterium]|nr:S8 family serine peptidase [Gammaproteobacteria bacterium]
MAARRGSKSETVSFWRGREKISLYESKHLIAVRLRDGTVPVDVMGRLGREATIPSSVRFVRRVPGRRVAYFHVPEGRDEVMDTLRASPDVQYCSHVFQRETDEGRPGLEVGLDNRIFVEFTKDPTTETLRRVESDNGLRAVWRFPEMPGGVVFTVTSAATKNPIKIANKLHTRRDCKTAEPCLVEPKLSRAIPSDPAFEHQWHLLNTGQGDGKAGADANAPAAWDFTWGDPQITIAVIDDGFDFGHPDLHGTHKIHAPYDATQRDTNPSPESMNENHGTACAGVAVANRGGAGLSIGMAPDCSWMPIRHAGQIGDFEEALAFYHAYRNGADVISCSWGPPDAYINQFWPMPSITRWVIDLCATRGRNRKGIPIFFAAGNGNEPLDLDGYANYENVIAVAACTNQDEKAWYSDYGENVWVTAPSNGGTRGIFTTDRRGAEGYSSFSDYTADFGGTSSATPLVAGIAGLMLSVNPELTASEVKNVLGRTAVKIGINQAYEYDDHWGNTYTDEYDADGHSYVYGWGRVDAGAAVRASVTAS